MNLQYIKEVNAQTRIEYLERELALARASSDYWRNKYITKIITFREDLFPASTWYLKALSETFKRTPVDYCDD